MYNITSHFIDINGFDNTTCVSAYLIVCCCMIVHTCNAQSLFLVNLLFSPNTQVRSWFMRWHRFNAAIVQLIFVHYPPVVLSVAISSVIAYFFLSPMQIEILCRDNKNVCDSCFVFVVRCLVVWCWCLVHSTFKCVRPDRARAHTR